MGLTDKFLVNTTKFESIIERLRTVDELPEKVNHEYLEDLGYTNPSDLLVLNILKELKLLNLNDTPTILFEKFRDEETTKEVIALGVVEAYADMFENNTSIYKSSEEELLDKFREHLGAKKSDLILKYMANTFKTLVNYAGYKNIEAALNTQNAEGDSITSILKEISERHKNGNSSFPTFDSQTTTKEESEETKSELKKEDKGATGIDEIIDPVDKKDLEESAGVEESVKEFEAVNYPAEDDNAAAGNTVEEEDEEDPFGDGKTEDSDEESNKEDYKPKEQMKATETISPDTMAYVDKALVKKADLLYKLGKYQEALPAYDKLFTRFADADTPPLPDYASNALIKKMKIAEKLDLKKELLPIYNHVIKRLADSNESKYVDHVDHAYVRSTEILVENNDLDESLDAIDAAIARFESSSRKADFLEKMMFMKGEMLEKMGRDSEALEAYDAFLARFGEEA